MQDTANLPNWEARDEPKKGEEKKRARKYKIINFLPNP